MNLNNCIYLITNDFDNKKYIGVTKNFTKRMYQHANAHDKMHSYIDKSINQHGWEHFTATIIDNYIDDNDRIIKEKQYILEYHTHRSEGGYNLTWGGDDYFGDIDVRGEKNGRAQLTEEDVKKIRYRRMNGERLSTVYEDYKDKLDGDKRAGFSKLWLHESWIDVCAEFKGHYPEINPKFFATIRRNTLTEYDINFLTDYFKWYGPITKYNTLYVKFKTEIDWESFQEVCKIIVESLYGNKSTRRYRNKNGETQRRIMAFREELKTEPIY